MYSEGRGQKTSAAAILARKAQVYTTDCNGFQPLDMGKLSQAPKLLLLRASFACDSTFDPSFTDMSARIVFLFFLLRGLPVRKFRIY